jgi:hypothetical protein
VMSFYNGSMVRMNGDSKVELQKVEVDDEVDQVELDVDNGTIWVNLGAQENDYIKFMVETDHLRITSYGTIFEVSMTDRETVRVVDGEVLVEVVEMDGDREVVLEQLKVGVGQQVDLTASDIEAIYARETVSMLEAIDDDWKSTAWYNWNLEEDADPSKYVLDDVVDRGEETDTTTDEDVVDENDDDEVVEGDDEDTVEEPVVEEDDADEDDTTTSSVTPSLELTSPDENPYTLKDGETSIAITGTASASVSEITVTSYDADGNGYAYSLGQFSQGDASWRYNAAEGYGNLREGRNLFSIVGETAEGYQSEILEVVIIVPEGAFGADEEDDETDTDTDTTEEDTSEENTTEEDTTESTEDITQTQPQILTANGVSVSGNYYSSAADEVLIIGSVSESAVAVYVNEYKLSQFSAGDTTWSYYAKVDYLNYSVGSNSYTVYAEDADGNISQVLSFELYYEAP